MWKNVINYTDTFYKYFGRNILIFIQHISNILTFDQNTLNRPYLNYSKMNKCRVKSNKSNVFSYTQTKLVYRENKTLIDGVPPFLKMCPRKIRERYYDVRRHDAFLWSTMRSIESFRRFPIRFRIHSCKTEGSWARNGQDAKSYVAAVCGRGAHRTPTDLVPWFGAGL